MVRKCKLRFKVLELGFVLQIRQRVPTMNSTHSLGLEPGGPHAFVRQRVIFLEPWGGVAQGRNEQFAPIVHAMALSALTRSDCGMVSPSALAVLRLITKSNFVGCSMGRSPGLAPLKILST